MLMWTEPKEKGCIIPATSVKWVEPFTLVTEDSCPVLKLISISGTVAFDR